MFIVKTITNSEELYSLKDTWNNLVNQSADNSIFLTWEWLYNWWLIYNKNKKLFIVLLFLNNELIAIAPLFTHTNKPNELYLIGSTNTGSDYLNFIIKKGFEQESLDFFFNLLLKKFYIINLTDVSSNSYLIKYLKQSKYHVFVKKSTVCPYINLPSSFNTYLNSLSKNMRYTINRKMKQYKNKFRGNFITANNNDDAQLSTFFNLFLDFNIQRMDCKGIESPFKDSKFLKFHRNILKFFSKNNWLQLSLLEVNNEPIAAIYNFKYNKKVYYYQSGFLTKWEKISPGVILFSYSIKEAIKNNMEIFDFLKGEEQYKFSWTKDFTSIYNIHVFSKRIDYLTYLMKVRFLEAAKKTYKIFFKKGGNNGW